MIEQKECIKCHKIKEITEFSSRQYSNGSISYRGECKECIKERQKNYQKNNKERIKQWHSVYYQTHKEELKIKNDEWWDKNRNKMNNHRLNKRKNKLNTPLIENLPSNFDPYKHWL